MSRVYSVNTVNQSFSSRLAGYKKSAGLNNPIYNDPKGMELAPNPRYGGGS